MESPKIRIVVSGDYCPSQHFQSGTYSTWQAENSLGDAVSIFKNADLAIANLEYPLTLENTKITKYGSHQKADPSSISVLAQAGINLVTLANNHILDYGEKGLLDTLNVCRQHGVDTVGAGMSLEQAKCIYYKDVRGIRIAVIAFCENEFSVASETHGGAAPMDTIENIEQIQEAKQNADVILVIIHGGNEFSHYPSPRVARQYRFYASLGVSAVIGHHPHYIQGYEIHNGVPILYSLGKLIYTKMKDPDILEVPIVILEFDPAILTCSVNFSFFKMSLKKAMLLKLEGSEKEDLDRRFKKYCDALQQPQELIHEWDRYCSERQAIYFAMITSLPQFVYRILRRLHLTQLIVEYARRKSSRLWSIEDMMRCESHRDVLLSLLGALREKNDSLLS